QRFGRSIEILEARCRRGAELRPRTQSHPRLHDDPEAAFAAAEDAIGARTRARTGQTERLQHAGRSHDPQRLDELVDMRIERRVVPTAARGDPATECGELERLRDVAQRQAARLELVFQRRPVYATLNARRLRSRIDLEYAIELAQVDG